MPLTTKQKDLIVIIDRKVNDILDDNGTDDDILVALIDEMQEFKSILDSTPTDELDACFKEYKGFYRYIKILEKLAFELAANENNK